MPEWRASGSTNATERVVEWEGRRYRVDAPRAEAMRLARVRQRQGGASLRAALESAQLNQKTGGGDRVLADTLTSILYAASLGDPQGPALAGGNVALRHELGATGVLGPRGAWRLPSEGHSGKGWRVTGSLLGLDVALSRLSLRRLDASLMPPEPRLVSSERQTASLTVSLLNPLALSDAARDEIAAALARGRARLDALDTNQADADQAARDAGLSAWRREALRWTIAHDGANRASQLSLVELMWLGRPRGDRRRVARWLGRRDAADQRLCVPWDAPPTAMGGPGWSARRRGSWRRAARTFRSSSRTRSPRSSCQRRSRPA